MKKLIFKNKGSNKGFTFIELIVVITVLMILSTIGYIYYNSYISESRDATRISQASSLVSAIEVYRVKGLIPMPEEKVTIYSSGEVIGYQGYINESILNAISCNNCGKDPKDDKYFTYYVNKRQRKMNILTFLENGINDNLDRVPVSYGAKVGVILDQNYNPIQDNQSLLTTGIDIKTTTDSYNVYFSDKENINGTGDLLQVLYGTAITGIIGETCDDYVEENAGYLLNAGYYLMHSSGSLEKQYCDMKYGTCNGVIPANAVSNSSELNGLVWSYNTTPGNCTYVCDTGYNWNLSICELPKYIVSGSFENGNGATVNVCGTNVIAKANGDFTSNINKGSNCANITATKNGYNCTAITGPINLTADFTGSTSTCSAVINECDFGGGDLFDGCVFQSPLQN